MSRIEREKQKFSFEYFGSYALVEVALLLIVLLPTLAVYKCTKE